MSDEPEWDVRETDEMADVQVGILGCGNVGVRARPAARRTTPS